MYEKNTDCVNDFWQQVAKFVCCITPKGVSNLYSFLKYLRYRETRSRNQGRRNKGTWRGHCTLPYERGGATGAHVSLHKQHHR